jgi:hypothetical protein
MQLNRYYNGLSKGAQIKRRTPRQELIEDAARYVKAKGLAPHMALEAVSSDCRTFGDGTLAAAMRAYYLGTTDSALERLIRDVRKQAQR